jgi:hypothetical protein
MGSFKALLPPQNFTTLQENLERILERWDLKIPTMIFQFFSYGYCPTQNDDTALSYSHIHQLDQCIELICYAPLLVSSKILSHLQLDLAFEFIFF